MLKKLIKYSGKTIMENQQALLILFVYFILLLTHAGKNSYWFDEIISIYQRGSYFSSVKEHFHFMYENHPIIPLFEITLYSWMKIFGTYETATRGLSLIFTSLSGWFVYLITKRIFTKRVAITSLLFFLFSGLIIMYAIEARYYGQMLFLTTLSAYILLCFLESIQQRNSWKSVIINKYFFALIFINFLLFLNHAFNYLFYFAQACFTLVYFVSYLKPGNLLNRTLKWFIITVSPIIVTAIVWNPILEYWLKAFQNINILDNIISIINILSLNFNPAIITGYILITIILIIVIFKIGKSDKLKINAYKLYSIISLFLLVLFITDFSFFGLKTHKNLSSPIIIALEQFGRYILILSSKTFYILFFGSTIILAFKVIRNAKNYHLFNRIILVRKSFLFYFIFVSIIPVILTSFVFAIRAEDGFYPRYLLYTIPPAMILLSYSIHSFADAISKHLSFYSKFNFKSWYLKNSFLISISFVLLFFGLDSYKMIYKKYPNSWREVSQQVINIVESDKNHEYLIIEASTGEFSRMNYYFHRYSNSIETDLVISKQDNKKMKLDKDYVPKAFSINNNQKYIKSDYMILMFIHPPTDYLNHVLEYINKNYTLISCTIDKNSHGYFIYDLHPDD